MKILLSLVVLGSVAQAAIVEFSGQPVMKISASGQDVAIYPEARLALNPTKESLVPRVLKLTGAGIREKTFLVVTANVYVLSSYTDSSIAKFSANPVKVIREGVTEALQLTLLRDLSAEKIRDSFTAALEENEVKTDSPAMKKVFSNLSRDFKEGEVITIVSQKGEGESELLSFEGPGVKFSVEGPAVATNFWKIWFGKPADSGLERLQKQLVASSGHFDKP